PASSGRGSARGGRARYARRASSGRDRALARRCPAERTSAGGRAGSPRREVPLKKTPAQERRNEWRASLQGPWPFVHTAGELDLSEREWLHTNGAGAFSMSTVALMHTRRHHGVLVAALDQPLGRHVIVSHAET